MKKNMLNTCMNIGFASGHVDAIRADCSDRRFFVVEQSKAKIRRPEVARKAAQLQRANPKLSDLDALVKAKAMITGKGGNHA